MIMVMMMLMTGALAAAAATTMMMMMMKMMNMRMAMMMAMMMMMLMLIMLMMVMLTIKARGGGAAQFMPPRAVGACGSDKGSGRRPRRGGRGEFASRHRFTHRAQCNRALYKRRYGRIAANKR